MVAISRRTLKDYSKGNELWCEKVLNENFDTRKFRKIPPKLESLGSVNAKKHSTLNLCATKGKNCNTSPKNNFQSYQSYNKEPFGKKMGYVP